MPSRDLANKRIKFCLATPNAIANILIPTVVEANALLDTSAALRFDGFDFGMQESDQQDDRSLTDDASATVRSFSQFGGAVPFFMPKALDNSSILRQVFNLVKGRNTDLVAMERVGYKDNTAPFVAGDIVNVYRILTDGWTPDVEGTTGNAYILNMLPRGDVNPWFILPAASPAAVTVTGAATQALTVGQVSLREAKYQGHNITSKAVWTSSNSSVAKVEDGIIVGLAAGTANIVATYPGGTASTAVAVTVSAP